MWKPLSKTPWMAPAGKWDSVGAAGGRVVQVTAKDLKVKPGNAIGNNPNPATANPASWLNLKAMNLTFPKHPPNYVRMHMLNGRIGGPGNLIDNLAPGSNKLNGLHYRKFEKIVINALKAGSIVDTFKMTAGYHAGGGKLATPWGKNAWNDTLSKLTCVATHIPKGAVASVPLANVVVNEIPGIDTKKNWLGY